MFRRTSVQSSSVWSGGLPRYRNVITFSTLSSPYHPLKWSEELDVYFCATWSWGSVLVFFAVSLLLLYCLVHSDAIFWMRSCGIILVPWFPSDTMGSKVSGGTASWLQAMSLGVASLPPVPVDHWLRRSCGEIFPSLWRNFCVAVLPLILQRRGRSR